MYACTFTLYFHKLLLELFIGKTSTIMNKNIYSKGSFSLNGGKKNSPGKSNISTCKTYVYPYNLSDKFIPSLRLWLARRRDPNRRLFNAPVMRVQIE